MSREPAPVRAAATPAGEGGLGAHMSIAGGLDRAFHAGREAGCDCLQIFVKNQRQWDAPPLREDAVRAFRRARKETGIRPVIAHASYLINLASPDAALRERSLRAVIDELERCEALDIRGLVLHPGAHMGEGIDAGIRRIAASLDAIHARTRGFAAKVLLESVAGQGTTIGATTGELRRILDSTTEPDRLGICLDTCHLFASGHDLRKPAVLADLIGHLDREIGLEKLRCIHVNDSKAACGSRVDRHEHIGKGRIGRRAFELMLAEGAFRPVPKILETPKGPGPGGLDWDTVNLKLLRRLAASGVGCKHRESHRAPRTLRRGPRESGQVRDHANGGMAG